MSLLFYISAGVAVISTLMVIVKKNAVHALLYLIVSLMAVALVFFALGAAKVEEANASVGGIRALDVANTPENLAKVQQHFPPAYLRPEKPSPRSVGVLEPIQANPVIIEDNCFIGARAEVAEGVIVGEGSVLSMGVYLGQSTRIINRATGEVLQGRVPPYSVVVSGAMPGKPLPDGSPGPSLYCAVIVKTVDERTRAKTSINELLRD